MCKTKQKTIQPNWANSKVIALIDWKKFNQHEENLNTIYMKDNMKVCMCYMCYL